MSRSALGYVLITNQSIKQLSAQNVRFLICHLADEYGFNVDDINALTINTNSDVCSSLCKQLVAKYKSLRQQDLKCLANTVTQSVQNQTHQHVHAQQIQHVHHSRYANLNELDSAAIDQIGSFLSQSDSIKLGYLSRQFYIETHKLSYLIQR